MSKDKCTQKIQKGQHGLNANIQNKDQSANSQKQQLFPNLQDNKNYLQYNKDQQQPSLPKFQNSDESLHKEVDDIKKKSNSDKDIYKQGNQSEVLYTKLRNLKNIHYENKSFCRQASPINAKFLKNIQTAVQMTEKKLGRKIEFNFDSECIQKEIINESRLEEKSFHGVDDTQSNSKSNSSKKNNMNKKNLIPKSTKNKQNLYSNIENFQSVQQTQALNQNDSYMSQKSSGTNISKQNQVCNNSQQFTKSKSQQDNGNFNVKNTQKVISPLSSKHLDGHKNIQANELKNHYIIQQNSKGIDINQQNTEKLKFPQINNTVIEKENVNLANQKHEQWKQNQIDQLPQIMESVNKNLNQCQNAMNQRLKEPNNKLNTGIQNKVKQEFNNMDMKITLFDKNQLQNNLDSKFLQDHQDKNVNKQDNQLRKQQEKLNDINNQLTFQNQTEQTQTMSDQSSIQQTKKTKNSSITSNIKPPHPKSKHSIIQKNKKSYNINQLKQENQFYRENKSLQKKKRSPSARGYCKTKSNNSVHSNNSQKRKAYQNIGINNKVETNQKNKIADHNDDVNNNKKQNVQIPIKLCINNNNFSGQQQNQQQKMQKNKVRNQSAHAPSSNINIKNQEFQQNSQTQNQNSKCSNGSSTNVNSNSHKNALIDNLFDVSKENGLGSSLFKRRQHKQFDLNKTNQFNIDSDLDDLMQIEFKNYDARSNLLDIQKQMLEYNVMNDVKQMKMVINQVDLQKA